MSVPGTSRSFLSVFPFFLVFFFVTGHNFIYDVSGTRKDGSTCSSPGACLCVTPSV